MKVFLGQMFIRLNSLTISSLTIIRSYGGKFINTVGCLKADGWIPFQNKEKIMNFILTEVEKSRYTEINGNSNQFRFNYFSRYSF